jgi:hypothetical protein
MNGTHTLQPLPVAVRAFAHPIKITNPEKRSTTSSTGRVPSSVGASPWSMTFDTETTVDAAQQLRVGTYQVRHGHELTERGFFYDPASLTVSEIALLVSYAERHGFALRTRDEFIEEVFYPVVYDRRGLCIGFNLSFDIARVAVGHCTARTVPNAFSFQLSEDRRAPRIQVRHLDSRAALIQFTAPPKQRSARSERGRDQKRRVRRGHFLDVQTTAGALLGGSWSLDRLAQHLKVTPKLDTGEHGGELTQEYLTYAANDVQTTWECYVKLRERYDRYGLTKTPIERIYSEASLGKAYLKQMGVRPWRELQPDFPPEVIGAIMQSYYGGRSEVHLRRVLSRVMYCDFLSMYPTVCALMGLWRFVIAERLAYTDATDETRRLLDRVTVEDARDRSLWTQLPVLVQVEPEGDLLPVRAPYDGTQYTIGENLLTGPPLWFTLAHCIAEKIRTGKSPRVVRAIRFTPEGQQEGLRPIALLGNPAYRVDPYHDDVYRRLIELRKEVQAQQREAAARSNTHAAAELDAVQLALKICANATTYGIFMELNVNEANELHEVVCYGPDGRSVQRLRTVEEPGRYFHPLLATLITGAARLMLAVAEQLAVERGMTWAFCDTDSMAFARPEGTSEECFVARVQDIVAWFEGLNPYAFGGSILKVEDQNYRLVDGKRSDEIQELYCWAIAAKRYALFTIGPDGHPVIEKASAHGLGHLLAPYSKDEAPSSIPAPILGKDKLGVDRWEYDVWYRIIEAALAGHPNQVRLDDLPNFDQPAVSRYAATTPKLLRWFRKYNQGRPYREQVRPFGFLLAFQARGRVASMARGETILMGTPQRQRAKRRKHPDDLPRAVAPYDTDHREAASHCFDRLTGEPVSSRRLMTYREALLRYHLQPEAKFDNGRWVDRRETVRRHVTAERVVFIGKEANRCEEQFHLGRDPEAQVEYGVSRDGAVQYQQLHDQRILDRVRGVRGQYSLRRIAQQAGVQCSHLSEVLSGKRKPSREAISKLEDWLQGQSNLGGHDAYQ